MNAWLTVMDVVRAIQMAPARPPDRDPRGAPRPLSALPGGRAAAGLDRQW